MTRRRRASRRLFDFAVALPLAVLSSPVVLAGWLAAALSTRSRGLFRQTRIGIDGTPFNVVKLRTMVPTPSLNTNFTASGDPRITRTGRVLRRSKADELPQLWQVLAGTMSLIGPRPDVEQVIRTIPPSQRVRVLSVRPGITGLATLYFRDEEDLLARVDDPESFSLNQILECKTALNLAYLEHSTIRDDWRLLWLTVTSSDRIAITDLINSIDPAVLAQPQFALMERLRSQDEPVESLSIAT